MNDMIRLSTDDNFDNEKVMEKIKKLKEVAVVSAASRSGMLTHFMNQRFLENLVFLDLSLSLSHNLGY